MSVFRLWVNVIGIIGWAAAVPAQSWQQDPFSGNWQISAGRAGEGVLSLHRQAALICNQQEAGGCLYGWQYDNSNNQMVVATRHGSLRNYRTIEAQSISVADFSFLRGNSWAHTAVKLTAAGDGYYDGAWEQGEQSEPESWTRLEPEISYIGTSIIGFNAYARLENWFEIGELVTVSTASPYDHKKWRKENRSRGNRPVFRLFITGENLWGFQEVSFPDALDFEVFAQGDLPPFEASNNELPPPGRWFRVVLWEHATPGLKTLRINGEDHKIFVEIPGFPEPVAPVYVSVEFNGLGQEETTILVDVDFTGLGLMQRELPVAVSFQGLGMGADLVNTNVSFVGLSRTEDAIETVVSFAGVAAAHQPISVDVSFGGLALPDVSPSVAVSFLGIARRGAIAEVSLQFQGLESSTN